MSTPGSTSTGLSRRRFLQAAAVTAGTAAWTVGRAQGAGAIITPPPPDGILVLVVQSGGNDGLNTVVPIDDGTYRSLRPGVAVDPAALLPAGDQFGFHPALRFLKSRWDAGQVAVVQGVGTPEDDLSHFTSMARWMAGWAGPPTPVASGWLGRFLDGLDDEPFRSFVVGATTPLACIGRRVIPTSASSTSGNFGTSKLPYDVRVFQALRALDDTGTGAGDLADRLAGLPTRALDITDTLTPLYATDLPAGGVARDLAFAARVINLGLGTRIACVLQGGYDTHANQYGQHATLLANLDDGLRAFFDTLDPAYAGRTVVAVISEFGRRPQANSSAGTDHGRANDVYLVGPTVVGGFHGQAPSLRRLDDAGQMAPTLDYRSVYATLLERWLGGDPEEILGARFDRLEVFRSAPSAAPPPPAPPRLTNPPAAPAPGGSSRPRTGFVPLTPARVLDTRDGTGGVAVGPIPANGSLMVALGGQGGLPSSGVRAVALNVTVTGAVGAGYLTVHAADADRPLASSLNFRAGDTVANHVLSAVDGAGRIAVFASASTQVVADVVGYYTESSAAGLIPLVPLRIADTRILGTPVSPDRPLVVPVAGRGGVPATGATAAVVNVTVTEPTRSGYLTVWPSGEPQPWASSLNFSPRATVPNLVVCKLGTDGAIAVAINDGAGHVVVDLVGCFAVGQGATAPGRLTPITPVRLLDTRTGSPVGPGGRTELAVADALATTAGASISAVCLNVTATEPTAASYVTVWPTGAPQPLASSLNVVPGQTVPNHVVAKLGDGGRVSFYNAAGSVHLVVDAVGYVT
jgi:uncharacterized protein (DUF1501 family)